MQNVKLLQVRDLQVLQARHSWREGEGEGHYRWVFMHCTLTLGVYGTHESICNAVIEIEISTYCVEVLQWRDTPP